MNLRYVLFLACTAATGGLLFGFDVAIISGAGPFLARHFSLGDFGLGVTFSSLLFGCALGAAIAGRLSDRYGRRQDGLGMEIAARSVFDGDIEQGSWA
ncbi:MAG: MFS transporter [Woeseiaceae bacterium]